MLLLYLRFSRLLESLRLGAGFECQVYFRQYIHVINQFVKDFMPRTYDYDMRWWMDFPKPADCHAGWVFKWYYRSRQTACF